MYLRRRVTLWIYLFLNNHHRLFISKLPTCSAGESLLSGLTPKSFLQNMKKNVMGHKKIVAQRKKI
jgi:hypothetical protein